MAKWHSTKYPGVRYREHNTRKHGVKFDRYFAVRYTLDGKRHEEALGWASEGWTPQNAAEELSRLKRAQRTGEGAYTLAERRRLEKARREAEEKERKEQEIAGITFTMMWEKYSPTAKADKAEKTFAREKNLYEKWLKPQIGNLPLTEIAPFHLEKIKKEMADTNKAARSIQYALSVVRVVFNYARDHNLFSGESPTSKVKIPHQDNKRIRFLSHKEAKKLLNTLATRSTDLHDMALLALHCGPRAGEIFGLTWQDIDFNEGLITFRYTKNGHVRHIPLTDQTKTMLEERKNFSTSELVFPARTGGRRKEVSNAFARTVAELGFNQDIKDRRQKVVFHTLRHTCASWLVMAGVPLYTVKEYLGHRQINQTERYAHLAPDSLQQATSVFNEVSSDKGRQPKVVNLSGPRDHHHG